MPAVIDPPEGWRYGFPKPIPEDVDRDEFLANLNTWLVANGYLRGPPSVRERREGSSATSRAR